MVNEPMCVYAIYLFALRYIPCPRPLSFIQEGWFLQTTFLSFPLNQLQVDSEGGPGRM